MAFSSRRDSNMAKGHGLSILNPALLGRAEALQQRFQDADPFPHVVIENFLEASFATALLNAFPAFEQGNCIGDDGRPGAKSTFERIGGIGSVYEQLDAAIKSREFLAFISRVTGIDELLYDPWYLGGGTHENRDGASLDPHVDFNFHPSERWHRRLNMLVYLNPTWKDEWGGCLELFRDPHTDVQPASSIEPAFNRCVIFETSEHSWHGFNRIQLPAEQADLTRRSIALYFYTKGRPVEQIADRHTTFYVDRKLPEYLVDGHTLSGAQVKEVRQLFDQRDSHIRNLYAENTLLRKAQDAGFGGHLLYLAKRAFVRFRR